MSKLKIRIIVSFNFLESPEYDLDSSIQKNNESHVSGILPFFSSEDINVSLNLQPTNGTNESVSYSFFLSNHSMNISIQPEQFVFFCCF